MYQNQYLRTIPFIILLLCIIFLLYFIFQPGYLSPDSITQFNQATSGKYTGWHPPLMAYFWGLLLKNYRANWIFIRVSLIIAICGNYNIDIEY